MRNNTLLIDGDMVVFQITSSHEVEVRWDNDIHTLHSRFSDCWESFEIYLKDIKETLDANHCVFAFSGSNNFRKQILPTYKANRKKSRKPLAYKRLVEEISLHFETGTKPTLEADDLLGIWATTGYYNNPIIVSDDKDLLSIPGRTYRLGELHEITVEQADKYHLTQTLTGDVADGYKGCPGIGQKKAEAILQPCEWDRVVQAFEGAGLTEQDALTQARVARILRASDWDNTKEKINLWHPNCP